MSYTRIVKGNYTKIVHGDYNMYAKGNITFTAGKEIITNAKNGIIHGEYKKPPTGIFLLDEENARIYELDKDGYLHDRGKSSGNDIIYASDQFENGILKQNAIGLDMESKGFIKKNMNQYDYSKDSNKKGLCIKFESNENKAKDFFFYAAENTTVEFMHTNITIFGKDNNYVSTNNEPRSIKGYDIDILGYSLFDTRIKYNYSIHNHPFNSDFHILDHPSGWSYDYSTNPVTIQKCDDCAAFGGSGDRGYAERFVNTIHYQYTPKSQIIRIYNSEIWKEYSKNKTYGK